MCICICVCICAYLVYNVHLPCRRFHFDFLMSCYYDPTSVLLSNPCPLHTAVICFHACIGGLSKYACIYSVGSGALVKKFQLSHNRWGEQRKGEERKGKERKGEERRGKERKGKERKGRGRGRGGVVVSSNVFYFLVFIHPFITYSTSSFIFLSHFH